MEASARAALAQSVARGRKARRLRFERFVAMGYPGQTFDMPVPLATKPGPVTARALADVVERFHRLHEELHTYASRDQEPLVRGVALKAVAVEERPALPKLPRRPGPGGRLGARKAFFRGRFTTTPVYAGPQLAPGQAILGPAIIEEPFTTVVVYPGQRSTVDASGNYVITLGKA